MTVRNTLACTTAFALGLMLAACGGGEGGKQAAQAVQADTTETGQGGLVNVGGKLFSIPSPVQTALLIRRLHLPYMPDLALSPDSASRFATKRARSLALGIYGADLGYITVNKDGQRALRTLKAIESIGSKLDLSHAFNPALMEGFRSNISNEDSLLRFTGMAFQVADRYLKNDQREDVSTLVLAGGWVESLYLTLGGSSGMVEPKVAARVAEQQQGLGNLIALLKQQGGDEGLLSALQDLATTYKAVSTTYKFQPPTTDVKNKTTYINSITGAEVTPQVLQEIFRKVKAIRTSITA